MTFREIEEKYGWKHQECERTIQQQILTAAARGVEIEPVGNTRPTQYRILNIPEEWFTIEQIRKKYGWIANTTISNFINYCKDRGVIIEQVGISKSPAYFKIIKELKTEWYENPKYPKIEISKLGLIRNKRTKRIYRSKNTQGYCVYNDKGRSTLVQRIIMETFNPVENMENLYVDHINGIRDDNRLENLRWATQRDNMIYRQENWKLIQKNFEKAVQKFGYEGLNRKLEELLIDN